MYFSSFYYDIDPQMVDINKNIKIPNLLTLLLNTAGRSSEEYHIGVDQLMEEGKAWVLSRLAIEMKEMPRHNERIRVDTWIETVERMFSLRNFQIVNHGNIIGEARSIFAVIDSNTRRPVNLMEEERFARLSTGVPVSIEEPVKIAAVSDGKEFHYTTCYSDMDFNGHCNSARYLEWMLNALPIEEAKQLNATRIDINYMREVMPGTEVVVKYASLPDRVSFDICDAGGSSVARALIVKQ